MIEETLVQQAIAVLMDTLGPVETIRFLSLPVKKRVESVKKALRDPVKFQRTALTGSSEETPESDKLLIGAKLIEKGLSVAETVELISKGAEELSKYDYYNKKVKN